MNLDQYDTYILVPALKVTNLYSPSAHVLMLGTILNESKLEYVEQLGPGTAMGFTQIESATHDDVKRYLSRWEKRTIKEFVLASCFYEGFPSDDALIHNMRYAVLIARVKYFMVPKELPEWNDSKGMAKYYKKYYNTSEGKADLDVAERIFADIIKHRF